MADALTARGRRRLLAQSAAALGLVAAIVALAVLFSRDVSHAIEQSRSLVARASAQSEAVRRVVDVVKDAETGQRGFLLTMKPAYLETYWAGRARLPGALHDLDRLVADSPELADDTAALREMSQQKMLELDRTVTIAREISRDAAVAVVQTDVGKATMDQVRDHSARLLERIAAIHEARLAEVRASERLSSALAGAAPAIGAALLGISFVAVLRGRARLEAARAALALQTSRLAGTIEGMRDGVALFDSGEQLVLWNQPFAQLAALPADLARSGTAFSDIAAVAMPGTDLPPLDGHSAGAMEYRRGHDVLEVWRSRTNDGGQIMLIADITRRTQAESIARQAQKMQSLGQLTGGVAHDFNNLLQVISANLELIGSRVSGDSWLAARLTASLAGVERAARLTRHLLAFARRQPLAPEAIDTRRLLSGMEDMLRRTLGQTVALEMVLSGGLWPVRADPQQLENAILNLAINARDAMAEGGRLTIEAANASLDADYAARHTEVTPGQYVAIAVTDTGIGMTPEQLERALEPFYTTKPEGRGTGLGLPMVFGFAKQSGGHLKLYSEPGHGTTVRLYIPRSSTAPRAATEVTETTIASSGELIMVVEDDATVRAASGQALRALGYRTTEAANAAAALDMLRDGVRPDLLFTDIVMPGQPDVRTLVAEAQRLVPGLAVVYTSGYTENAVVHNGQLDPGITLISKPWRLADLERRLRHALDAQRLAAGTPRKLRVLLVEDEALVRMTTADLLADMGHEVMEAGSGADALRMVEMSVDVMVTDLGLPDIDGMDLAAQATARRPGLRVIIASGREAGNHPYVSLDKPYDQSALRHALELAVRSVDSREDAG